jgi:hypothetical protein
MTVAAPLRTAAALLAVAVLALSWTLAGGPLGWAYVAAYVLALLPGLPIGFALFGRSHAAGWIGGAAIGYAITAILLWAPVQARLPPTAAGIALWAFVLVISVASLRRVAPLVTLPAWSRRDSLALVLVLLMVPALLWKPFTSIGSTDATGSQRYRAYFTADFLWHVALTAELERAQSPPRNPYLARRPLNYYWAYYVLPATVSRWGVLPSIQSALTINALCAGVLFISCIFIAAWCCVPRAGPVAIAVLLTVLCASAEGAYALWDLWARGRPLSLVTELNIDAITSWFFQSLTIDSLPRCLWYTPQHAAACGLGLVGLMVAGAAEIRARVPAALWAGLALGFSVIFSPFIGGVFALMYGLTALCTTVASNGWRPSAVIADIIRASVAALPTLAGLGWCIAAGTFEGAGGAVTLGLSSRSAATPVLLPLLAIGPVLVPALVGLAIGARRWPLQVPVVGLCCGLFLLYLVTLTLEPIWVGWRAGQIILVTIPALLAGLISVATDRFRPAAAALVLLLAVVGLPTTAIDWWNAQDVSNDRNGPGFRWTVVVPPDTQAAVRWIREHTPVDAVVQMSIEPRGRETWTLVPTFAERRMAAGKPISLLQIPEYQERSAQADTMFQTVDPAEASRLARALRLDYVYLDRVEREAFGEAAAAKFLDSRFFTPAFSAGSAAVFAVR